MPCQDLCSFDVYISDSIALLCICYGVHLLVSRSPDMTSSKMHLFQSSSLKG